MKKADSAAADREGTGRRGFVGSRPFKLGLIAILLVGAYALIGFLALPKWIRIAAVDAVQAQLGMPLGLGEIRVNPFLFTLEIRDISLPDAARDAPLVALDRLHVDFESSSLWHRALVFRDIELGGPFARVIVLPDGSVNLARLAPQAPAEPEPTAEEASGLPALWIQSLAVSAGRVNFADRSRRETPEKEIAPIEFALKDFRTNPEGGAASLDARSEDGEGFAWEGRIALTPVSSQGRFSVTALKARTVWEFLSEQLPAELTSGSIDLNGSYEFALDPTLAFKVELPEIKVSQLDLKALDADAPWVTVDGITLSDTAVTNRDQSVRIDQLAVNGVAVDAWLEPDGSLNLLRLAGPGNEATGGAAESARTAQPAEAADETTSADSEATLDSTTSSPQQDASDDWSVDLARLAISNANIAFEDRTFTPPNPTKVGPLTLTASGLSLDRGRRIALTVEATINDHGLLTVKGDLAPDPLAGDLDVTYRKGSILVAQPYVSRVADLTVRQGAFEVEGRLALRPEGTAEPWLAFAGDVVATDLHTVDNVQQQDLINFERLDAQGIEFALAPDKLAIAEVAVTKPFARVIIEPDQTINVAKVFAPAGTSDAGSAAPPQEREEQSPEARPPAAAAEPAAFPITIDKVTVKGGTLDFSDFFIQPNFQAKIDALNGRIDRMSSDPASHAKLAFNGHVISEYSPVSITGDMNLFSFDRYTDVDLQFRNIDLPVFNPYSGKFAGYAIAKGKLTTELEYDIRDRQLEAQHHIKIDQLEWGQKSDSKDAVTLPVKLATALLKDRNGVIDLDVPVGGSLDDPTFELGPIIWKVVKNLLVKIVTAPFAFIGSLFQGAENAQYITFAAGSAELTADNAESLAALAKALLERPQLKLEVPVRVMPEIDRPALIQREYDAALATAAAIAAGKPPATPVDFSALEPDQQLEALTGMYTVLAGSPPSLPEPTPPPEGTSRKDAKQLALAQSIDYLQDANRSLIEIPDDRLRELAEARAQAVQQTLLSSAAIDPERVFITAGEKVNVDGEQVKLELGLE